MTHSRAHAYEGSYQKMRDRPAQDSGYLQRFQILKEESTAIHFPWRQYPSIIIESSDDAYLVPYPPFFFTKIGFREFDSKVSVKSIFVLVHCKIISGTSPNQTSLGTFISWSASYGPMTKVSER